MRHLLSTIALLGATLAFAPAPAPAQTPRTAMAALAMRLPDVKFEGTRFVDAIDHLREVSGANFNVNWRALETVGITRDTPVTFTARRISLRKALQLVLSQSANPGELAFYNDRGVIEVTTKALADELVLTRIYDVQDLLILPLVLGGNNGGGTGGGRNGGNAAVSGSSSRGNSRSQTETGSMMSQSRQSFGGSSSTGRGRGNSGESSSRTGRSSRGTSGSTDDRAAIGDELAAIIIGTVEPEIWQENGGNSSIRYFRGNLIISAPRRIHELIGGPFE